MVELVVFLFVYDFIGSSKSKDQLQKLIDVV